MPTETNPEIDRPLMDAEALQTLTDSLVRHAGEHVQLRLGSRLGARRGADGYMSDGRRPMA